MSAERRASTLTRNAGVDEPLGLTHVVVLRLLENIQAVNTAETTVKNNEPLPILTPNNTDLSLTCVECYCDHQEV